MACLHNGPLRAYRIADGKYPILDGGGAEKWGGRWSSPGRRVIYAAATYAGAILEKRVHANIPKIPDGQVSVAIDVPANVLIEVVEPTDLPVGWRDDEAFTRAYGDLWYDQQRTAVLIVPSAVAQPHEKNVLINQRHSAFASISATTPTPVCWDERLFTSAIGPRASQHNLSRYYLSKSRAITQRETRIAA